MRKVYKRELPPILQKSQLLASAVAFIMLFIAPFFILVYAIKTVLPDALSAYADLFAVILQNYEES